MSDRQTSPTPTCEPVRRGFGPLRCLECGVAGKVSVDLDDMTDDEAFQCRECEGVFGVADVVAIMGQWQRVLDFVAAAPQLPDEE
jgi:hypothetical protein